MNYDDLFEEIKIENSTLIPNKVCGKKLSWKIRKSQFCDQKCFENFDGPIFMNKLDIPYLIGVKTSQNCDKNAPSVYTRISDFRDWIESIVWKTEEKDLFFT